MLCRSVEERNCWTEYTEAAAPSLGEPGHLLAKLQVEPAAKPLHTHEPALSIAHIPEQGIRLDDQSEPRAQGLPEIGTQADGRPGGGHAPVPRSVPWCFGEAP